MIRQLSRKAESQVPTRLTRKYTPGAHGSPQALVHWSNLRLHPGEGRRLLAVDGPGRNGGSGLTEEGRRVSVSGVLTQVVRTSVSPAPHVSLVSLLITLLGQKPPFAPLLSTGTQQLFAEVVDVLALTGRRKASPGSQISDK